MLRMSMSQEIIILMVCYFREEHLVRAEPLDYLVRAVHQAHLVQVEAQAHLVQVEAQVLQEHLAQVEAQVLQEHQVQVDQVELLGLVEVLAHLVHQVLLEHLVHMVLQEHLAHQVQAEHQDQVEAQVYHQFLMLATMPFYFQEILLQEILKFLYLQETLRLL
jgi:hypothetical protein